MLDVRWAHSSRCVCTCVHACLWVCGWHTIPVPSSPLPARPRALARACRGWRAPAALPSGPPSLAIGSHPPEPPPIDVGGCHPQPEPPTKRIVRPFQDQPVGCISSKRGIQKLGRQEGVCRREWGEGVGRGRGDPTHPSTQPSLRPTLSSGGRRRRRRTCPHGLQWRSKKPSVAVAATPGCTSSPSTPLCKPAALLVKEGWGGEKERAGPRCLPQSGLADLGRQLSKKKEKSPGHHQPYPIKIKKSPGDP